MLEINFQHGECLGMQLLTFIGELDLSEKEKVRSCFSKVLDLSPKSLVVDVSDVTFMDSSGIGLLVSFYVQLKGVDIDMAIILSDNNYLMQKFRHLGIFSETGIAVFASREEAEMALAFS